MGSVMRKIFPPVHGPQERHKRSTTLFAGSALAGLCLFGAVVLTSPVPSSLRAKCDGEIVMNEPVASSGYKQTQRLAVFNLKDSCTKEICTTERGERDKETCKPFDSASFTEAVEKGDKILSRGRLGAIASLFVMALGAIATMIWSRLSARKEMEAAPGALELAPTTIAPDKE